MNDVRAFSTARLLREKEMKDAAEENGENKDADGPAVDEIPKEAYEAVENSIEETVIQARQTFGETLPKDYLTSEEYALYERLYGAPLRETTGEDLEFLVEPEDEADDVAGGSGRVRNVLLRENEDGEFEEVDFDPEERRVLSYGEMREVEDISELTEEELKMLEEEEMDELTEEELQMLEEDYLEQLALEVEEKEAPSKEQIRVQARNQREKDVILRLQRDMEAAKAQPVEEEEEIDEEFEEEEEEDMEEDEEDEFDEEVGFDTRSHHHTIAGRWGTSPGTITLPKETFVEPVTELLERVNFKHLTEAAKKAFGGEGLPYSTSTPTSKKLLPQKHIGLDAGQHKMSEVEADAYMATILPGIYASAKSTLIETRKRLGPSWIRDLLFREGGEGPRILDIGAGAGVIAWREILQAEWDVLRAEGIVEGEHVPEGKSTVLTGPSTLRHRMSRLLENTTFLPRLPDYLHSSSSERVLDGAPAYGRKYYDVIIAPHTLFPLKEDYKRKTQIQNLWSLLDPNGGVLILIEKGLPRGFEAIAGARSLLLNSYIASAGEKGQIEKELQGSSEERFRVKDTGMIVAPCTNHTTCPMYKVEGFSSGRKDYCHFSQRYIRPPFLQRILGAKGRNHEDIKFSYLAVRKGVDSRALDLDPKNGLVQGDAATEAAFAGHEVDVDSDAALEFNPLSLPRAVLPAIKRRGHVTFDVCTPSGTLERWTVPKSFSTQAYRDARKSKWGDLWALGAKTRTVRSVRLGKQFAGEDGEAKLAKKMRGKGSAGIQMGGTKRQGDGEMKKKDRGAGKRKKNVFEIQMGETGMEGIKELRGGKVYKEKRTRGGRLDKPRKDIGDDDF
jgi:ribosomal protein RSM22 (predicted rRNA methylase)